MKKILGILMFLILVGMVSAVDPIEYAGNPSCADLGYDNEFKIEPPATGVYDDITFTLYDDLTYFDWSSTFYIDAVIAKGANAANAYVYMPASMGDTGLVSPSFVNKQGNLIVPELSHATFCWNEKEVPEFGVIAGAVALVGALGIFLYRRK